MNTHADLIAWCQQERRALREQIRSFEAGEAQLIEEGDEGSRDATAAFVARSRLKLAELDHLLQQEDFEARLHI